MAQPEGLTTAMAAVYALLCGAGILLDTYSLAAYFVRRRRPGWTPIPLAGLILYVLAGMLRVFTGLGPLVVQWELLALVAYHLVVHAVVPLSMKLAPGK